MDNHFSINEVSEKTKISVPTLYRMIKKGKISAIKDKNNHYKIDLSEVYRVFSHLKINSSQMIDGDNDLINRIKELEYSLKHKNEVIELLKSNNDNLKDNIDNLKKSLLLLENKLNKGIINDYQNDKSNNNKTGFFSRLFNFNKIK